MRGSGEYGGFYLEGKWVMRFFYFKERKCKKEIEKKGFIALDDSAVERRRSGLLRSLFIWAINELPEFQSLWWFFLSVFLFRVFSFSFSLFFPWPP